MIRNYLCLSLVGLALAAVVTAQARDEVLPFANFRAEQSKNKLTVHAEGLNNTGGWKNELTALPIDVSPPEFKFTQVAPTGNVTTTFTPFAVKVTVDAGGKLEHVFVTDKLGKHKVAVKQLP